MTSTCGGFTILQSEGLDPVAASWLRERANLIVHHFDAPGFNELLERADGLIVRTYTQVRGELLDKSPHLKVVGRAGVALNNIDVRECRRRGIEVVHCPGSNAQAVVEYVLHLVCDALRPRCTFDRSMTLDEWERIRAEVIAPEQIAEKTVGILGFGRIGGRVAQVMSAIGCEVLYCDIIEIPSERRHGATRVEVEELFERSDVLTIHIDARPENYHFVTAEFLARLKPNVLLLNTSRGLVIDHAALAAFLRQNPRARAVLDVHDPEPPPADYVMFGLANAKLYPHLAGRTKTALTSMSWVVKDVLAVLEGRKPEHPAP